MSKILSLMTKRGTFVISSSTPGIGGRGKKSWYSPQWIDRVSWDDKTVFINLSREAIKQSPEYTDESLLTRDYEIGLHGHYNRKGYWVDELVNS